LGVQLGRVCLNKDIPVSDVASFFGVSRMTVYSWFRGKSIVSGKHAEKMKKLVDKLK
jgi:predicted transcriptional regulator